MPEKNTLNQRPRLPVDLGNHSRTGGADHPIALSNSRKRRSACAIDFFNNEPTSFVKPRQIRLHVMAVI